MKEWKNYIAIAICTVIFTIVYSRVVPLYMTEKQYLISATVVIVGFLVVVRIITKMRNKGK